MEKDKNWKIKLTHTKNASITFDTSNAAIAKVDNIGKVTGIAPGNTTITITVKHNGVTDKYYAVVRVTDENSTNDVSYLKIIK